MTAPALVTAAEAGLELPVYLDFQATTPTDPRAVEAMLPYFSERFGNPHSAQHAMGRAAEEAIDAARAKLAALLSAEPREIVFTSGATESNNVAIKGVAAFFRGRKSHIVTCVTEHKCLLESCRHVQAGGVRVTYLPVGRDGLIDLNRLREAIDEETMLVSIMAVNNEIGVIQPVAEIGAICRDRGVYFHTDAAQAVGKIPLDVRAMNIDLMSVSGHKMYGPKGIGALYVRRRPRVRLEALMSGGGQERGLRSGTLPTPLCVGFGEAGAIAEAEMEEEAARLSGLRRRLMQALTARLDDVYLNGDDERRIPGNLNLAFAGVDAEALMASLPDLCLSTGSACTSAEVEPSYVLRALGLPEDLARASLRIGLGRFTSEAEVDFAAARIAEAVERLRRAEAAK